MPAKMARKSMLKFYLSKHVCDLKDEDFEECAVKTEGYSGSDIRLLCKEAAMRPVRKILKKLESIDEGDQVKNKTFKAAKSAVKPRPICSQDLRESLSCTKPSSGADLCAKYCTWNTKHGSI